MNGDDTAWTLDRHLLAAVVDALRVANWQRGGGKRKDRPDPIPRPGTRPATTRIGDASRLTRAAAKALLDARKPRPERR